MKKFFLCGVVIILGALQAVAQNGQSYLSPDGALSAVVTGIGTDKRDSRIEILSKDPVRLLRTVEYWSANEAQAFALVKGAWTPDGQFFVYSLANSSGRDRTHFPTYFYSRKLNEIRSLETTLDGGIFDSQFTLTAPNTFETELIKNGSQEHVKVELSTLDKPAEKDKPETPAK